MTSSAAPSAAAAAPAAAHARPPPASNRPRRFNMPPAPGVNMFADRNRFAQGSTGGASSSLSAARMQQLSQGAARHLMERRGQQGLPPGQEAVCHAATDAQPDSLWRATVVISSSTSLCTVAFLYRCSSLAAPLLLERAARGAQPALMCACPAHGMHGAMPGAQPALSPATPLASSSMECLACLCVPLLSAPPACRQHAPPAAVWGPGRAAALPHAAAAAGRAQLQPRHECGGVHALHGPGLQERAAALLAGA